MEIKMKKKEVKNGRYVDNYGIVCWYKNSKLHCEDGPAIEWPTGSKEWYLEGERHREDGPAIEYANGDKSWYINGFKYTKEEFNLWTQKKHLNERLQLTLEEKPQGKKVKI